MTDNVSIVKPASTGWHEVCILIPTLNEVENIAPLLGQVSAALQAASIDAEVLIVDGGSGDGTQAAVRNWRGDVPVRLAESDAKRGLAGDIVYGAGCTQSPIVVVMDADLSHPPDALGQLIEPLRADTHDMVIGSRYVRGGSTPAWPWWRRLMSRCATVVAWPLVSVKDPMSGFFAVKRQSLIELGREAAGFKIALEILARSDDKLRVTEVPITFHDRAFGESKLGMRDTVAYFKQTLALAGGAVETGNLMRFAMVGLTGLAVDLLIFNVLLWLGSSLVTSHLTAFAVATVVNYVLNARWAFAHTAKLSDEPGWKRYMRYLTVCLLAVFMRGAVLSLMVESLDFSPQLAILFAIAAATTVNFVGAAFFIFPQAISRTTPTIRWRVLAISVVGYALLLRFAFAGLMDLLPEEAYYWMYSQHIDIGYLDHPPMVSWLIWLGTAVLGKTELGVRLPAYLLWLVTAGFMYATARNLFDKTTAIRTVMLVAALPIYFSTGLLMMPDAPLYACWAGCLYFLSRVFFDDRRWAWLGVGVCFGLGMLSKYTIALIGPAGVMFMLIDARSRRWFFRPGPYVAVLMAAVLFSPVIIWNYQHDWASFTFQGSRRWSGSSHFSLHILIGWAMLLLTPLGLAGAVKVLLPSGWSGLRWPAVGGERNWIDRRQLFGLIFACVPLAVFVINSLQKQPKLNWTGPVWLAVLPLIGWEMGRVSQSASGLARFGSRLWGPTMVATLLIFGGGMYYVVLGMPGLSPNEKMRLPVAWQEMGSAVELIEDDIKNRSGDDPIQVGLDKYFVSSQIAFYDGDNDGPDETYGRDLFGHRSLMWARWRSVASAAGKTVIVIDFQRAKLLTDDITSHFLRMSDVRFVPLKKYGRTVGGFYYRVGYGYRSEGSGEV